MSKRKKTINPPLNMYKKIAISFVVLTLILIVAIFYFTLSYAYVTIYPQAEEISSEFNFFIVEDESLANAQEGLFAGKIVNQEFEGEKTFTTTGTKTIYSDTVGTVKIYNNLSRDQILIATTRLLTSDGVLFRLEDRVTVPGGGSVDADVYADDPSQPLAKAGTQFSIPGLSQSLQQFVYAEAEKDFQAEGTEIRAISQGEFEQATASFAKELAQQVFDQANADKTKILKEEIISREFSNELGDEVNEYTLNLKIRVVGVMFDDQPVKDYAKDVLANQLPLDKDLAATNIDQLIYKIVNYDLDNKLVKLESSVSGTAIISETSDKLNKDKLKDLSIYEIEEYLENFEEIEAAEVNFFPGWIKKMPRFEDHIIITIEK